MLVELKPFHPHDSDLAVHAEIWVRQSRIYFFFRISDPRSLVKDSLVGRQKGELQREDLLWQKSCLEAFWGIAGAKQYWELNLSLHEPRWNLYCFEDYRVPSPPRRSESYRMEELKTSGNTLECILAGGPTENLEASLCAILRTTAGAHYFSQNHADKQPNFHDRRSFKPLNPAS